MRGTGWALGLGILGLGTLAALNGCGELWRPFLEPEVVPPSDLAVADLAVMPPFFPDDLGAPLWSAEKSGTTQNLYGVWSIKYTYTVQMITDGGTTVNSTSVQMPVFAVGTAGTILQRATSGVWSATMGNSGSVANLYAVTGRTPSDVIAVGDGQLVTQWNGSRWAVSQGAGSESFFGVTPLANQTGYLAVGAAGVLSVIAGTARSVPTGYTRSQVDLTSIYSSDPRVWIGTARGDLIKYEQGSFSAYGLPAGNAIRAVWAHSATDVWAVGDGGYVLRFDGTSWSTTTTRFPAFTLGLHGVTGNSRGEVWIVGDSGTILYFNGTAWSRWQDPSLVTLRSVFLEPISGNLWAVGDQGIILHALTAPK